MVAKTSSERERAAIQASTDGATFSDIARKLGCSTSTAFRICERNGITSKNRKRLRDGLKKQMVDLLITGYSACAAARIVGISESTGLRIKNSITKPEHLKQIIELRRRKHG